MTWNENWPQLAACKDDPEQMFVTGAEQHQAKKRCFGCPVRTECLAEALDNQLEWGVWGGLTERERRATLKTRPNVTSWRRLLETARAEQAPVSGTVPELPLRRLVAAGA
jgi:WhiB family redox-sensing transcriptional regulator